MKFGWGFTGELRLSDEDKLRVYDSTIDEVVRLDHEDVVDIARIDGTPPGAHRPPRIRTVDED